ncbi:hypothetical protein Tco_0924028 [Tanacetum coccineum]|uniref:Uncharacterized protein n=1 Tax=Tanacetum coccineum TaxID=301880 RepID=A0ABQ5D9Q5_9ASTR
MPDNTQNEKSNSKTTNKAKIALLTRTSSTLIPYLNSQIAYQGKNKDGVGNNKYSSWNDNDEMKLTKHYQMYDAMFGVDVPTTQSQLIESTQGTHRITSASRSPNPNVNEGELMLYEVTVIRLREGVSKGDYELKRMGKRGECKRILQLLHPSTTIRSLRIHSTLISSDSDKLWKPSTVFSRDQDDPHDDALPEGENSAKRQ